MKKLLSLLSLAIAIGIFGAFEASAQKSKPGAKDMFTRYNDGNNSTAGYEGAKVSVLLKRGNQPEKIVSPNETFYSGDKIKLVFDINFSGYAAIVNTGPTGNETLLFPHLDRNSQVVSHRVSPNAGTQLPRGNDWIVFDDKTGSERVTVIFSKTPLLEIENYQEAVTGGSDGRIASESEADAVLAELNSKSLKRGKSKDLSTQVDSTGTYSVVQNGLGNEPVAFTFYLKHK